MSSRSFPPSATSKKIERRLTQNTLTKTTSAGEKSDQSKRGIFNFENNNKAKTALTNNHNHHHKPQPAIMGPFSGGIGRFARKKQDAAPVANGGGGGGVSSGDGNIGCAANSGAAVAENANTTTAGNSTGMAPDGGMSGTDPSNAVADTADGMDVDDPSSLNFGSLDDRPATSGSHGFASIGNMFGGMDEMGDDDNMADMTGMMHLPDGGVDIGNGHAGMDHDGSFENSEFVPSFESRPTTTDGFQFGHQDAMDGGGFGATNHNECMDQGMPLIIVFEKVDLIEKLINSI